MVHGTRIGILGGTFDPIHVGHVDTALAAKEALALERVLILPSGAPPHRQDQPCASRFHRFAMAALAANGIRGLMVSDLEIGEAGRSYTFDTLARLHATGVSAAQIFFITGADAFAEIETWSRFPQVLEMAHFVVVSRPDHPAAVMALKLPALAARMSRPTPSVPASAGSPSQLEIFLVDARTRDVSSTEIRRRRRMGMSIQGLVPPAVETYICDHELYSQHRESLTKADQLHDKN
jgi:nicotinate-nucleotide adenylyltransferase